jgi:hypothetical protein
VVGAVVAWGWLALGTAGAGCDCPAPAVPLCLEQLARLSWPELEQLYRQAEARPIPAGYARGRAIYCSDSRLAGPRGAVTGLLWHGKLFDGCDCTLVNQWLGFRAVKARVYFGTSWLDGKPALVMDYRGTSRLVWTNVRDELREVAPGLFLGAMYRCKKGEPRFQMFFVLQAPCPK